MNIIKSILSLISNPKVVDEDDKTEAFERNTKAKQQSEINEIEANIRKLICLEAQW